MNGIVTGLFLNNEWQFVTLICVGTAVYLFQKGWKIYHQSHKNQLNVKPRRRMAFMIAMSLVAFILGTPIHHLATRLFSVHVGQHILLMALIPCLITYSNPLPILALGIPKPVKTSKYVQIVRVLLADAKSHLIQMSNPGVAFVLATVTFWIWYDPQIHQLTLQYRWVHTVETTLLLSVALLYWWHILGAEPHWHKPMPPVIRILYTMIGTWPIKIVGLILLFSNQNIYPYPDAYQFSGLNINDQGVGAILVWAIGGFVFSTTATILARDWLHHEEVKPIDPAPAWQTDHAMRAPGFPSS